MVHGCHSSSLESQETVTHQSSSFSCCTDDPQPRKMSCPSVITTSAWQLWDSLQQRQEEERGQPWLCRRGADPRKPHAGVNRRLQKAAAELETQDAEEPLFTPPWERFHQPSQHTLHHRTLLLKPTLPNHSPTLLHEPCLGPSNTMCFPVWIKLYWDNPPRGPSPAWGFNSSIS